MSNGSNGTNRTIYRFDVDGMLGRLAKWLRILGFDAAFPRPVPSEGRIFVTMKKDTPPGKAIRITTTGPVQQLKELLEQSGIDPDRSLFFTRCLVCNVPVRPISRNDVAGKIPEPVSRMTSAFNMCPGCGRVYWEGSHGKRIGKVLKQIEPDKGRPENP